jgi:hypothetical protein
LINIGILFNEVSTAFYKFSHSARFFRKIKLPHPTPMMPYTTA